MTLLYHHVPITFRSNRQSRSHNLYQSIIICTQIVGLSLGISLFVNNFVLLFNLSRRTMTLVLRVSHRQIDDAHDCPEFYFPYENLGNSQSSFLFLFYFFKYIKFRWSNFNNWNRLTLHSGPHSGLVKWARFPSHFNAHISFEQSPDLMEYG